MTKKEKARIEEIFSERINSLVSCAGSLALEKLYEDDKEFYDREIQEIDNLINILHNLEKQILE
jgi:hypothetical protein